MTASTKARMIKSISRSKAEVFTRAHFDRFGTPSRVTRALADLQTEGRLIKLGYGVYSKAMPSAITGQPIPRRPLEELAVGAFDALGIEVSPGAAASEYANGKSTQVPLNLVISTGRRRITRQLGVGDRKVTYAKNR